MEKRTFTTNYPNGMSSSSQNGWGQRGCLSVALFAKFNKEGSHYLNITYNLQYRDQC